VEVSRVELGMVTVTVTSKLTLIDWGKNWRNLERLARSQPVEVGRTRSCCLRAAAEARGFAVRDGCHCIDPAG
jgi:hypothetical protein